LGAGGVEEQVLVLGPTDVLKVRRLGRELSARAGLDPGRAALVETALAELATNLVKHRARSGRILIRVLEEGGSGCIEMESRDLGPGMAHPEAALQDGRSTSGTLGIGLSGVKRMMDLFELRSEPGRGTVVRARKYAHGPTQDPLSVSVLARPKPGERVSGDAHFIRRTGFGAFFSVIDVLGHGPDAHATALRALEVLEGHYQEPIQAVLSACHRALQRTQGAAAALCRLDLRRGVLEHLCVGNVETRIFRTRALLRPFCANGTVGLILPGSTAVSSYPLEKGMIVVMHSDGVSGKFDLPPNLASAAPAEIASHIFERHARDTDDATLLVARVSGHG